MSVCLWLQLKLVQKKLNDTVTKTTSSINKATSGTVKAQKAVDTSTKSITQHSSKLSSLIKKITQVTFVLYTLRKAFSIVREGFTRAVAYVENLNLFMVALGENTTKASGFVQEMSESLYLDEATLTRVQGLFYQISTSLGLATDKSYTLSENFTKLAYDISSLYNIDFEDAVVKLQAGLVGETEPLRRVGIILTENNLAETAHNLGIKKSIRNMTEQEKIQLRYVTALQQTKNAQGDLARTILQPENLMRVAVEQFHVLTRELGNAFIPMLEDLAPKVISFTISLTKLVKAFALSQGYEAPEISNDLGQATSDLADNSEEAEESTSGIVTNLAKALKYVRSMNSATTGIDELNIVGDDTYDFDFTNIIAETATSASDSIDIALDSYDNGMANASTIFNDMVEQWDAKFKIIGDTFDGVFDSTIDSFKNFLDVLTGDDDWTKNLNLVRGVLDIINSITTGIFDGLTKVVETVKSLYENHLKPILDSVAPDWYTSLTDGSLTDIVTKLTTLFVLWKGLKIATGVVSSIANLTKLAGNATAIEGLTGLFSVMAGVTLGADVLDKAKENIDAMKVSTEETNAQIKELEDSGFDGNITAKINESATFDASISSKPDTSLSGMIAEDITTGYTTALGIKDTAVEVGKTLGNSAINSIIQGVNSLAGLITLGNFGWSNSPYGAFDSPVQFDVKAYAEGGTPKKGSLFIAGEAGAELVGDLGNGGTSVVNQKQMAELGIPQFAGGANVPKWTDQERRNQYIYNTYGDMDYDNVITALLDGFTVAFSELGKETKSTVSDLGKWFKGTGVGKLFSGVGSALESIGTTVFDGLKTAGEYMWDGVSDSMISTGLIKSFETLKTVVGVASKAYKSAGKVVVNFYEAFQESDVQAIMSTSVSDGGTSTQQQDVMADIVGSMLTGVPSVVFSVMQSIADGTLTSFVESLPTFIEAGMDMIVNLIDGVNEALPELLAMIPTIITDMVSYITDEDTLNSIINGLLEMVVQIALALPDIMVALIDAIPTIITSVIDALIGNADQFAKVGVILAVSLVDGLINTIIAGINVLIELLNKIPFVSIGLITYSSSMADSVANVMGYADGGFPTDGQMFVAREAGAEMVGSMGGRTAVANNDQIVEGISSGVYEAVSKAMSENSSTSTVINLDGKKVSTGLDVADRTRGKVYGMGGF